MASSNSGDRQNRKASSLTEPAAAPSRRPTDAPAMPAKDNTDALQASTAQPVDHRGVKLAVDIILILVFVGLAVGGFFGYRALKKIYAPQWETREVTVILELTDVDPAIVPRINSRIYLDLTDGQTVLGTCVTGQPGIMPPDENGVASTNKYYRLVLKTTARYRAGAGYFVDDYPLLAGIGGTYRFSGGIAKGTILAVYEPGEEESTAEGTTATQTTAPEPAPEETTAAPEVTTPEEITTGTPTDTDHGDPSDGNAT